MRMMQRLAGAGFTAALVGIMAVPAAASAPPKPVYTAAASFSTTTPQRGVSVQIDEQHGRHAKAGLFLFVTEQFCDTVHDQMVFRSFLSTDPLKPSESKVNEHLRYARLDATVTMSGDEQRLEGCDAPSGIPVTTDLGTVKTRVDVLWIGHGEIHDVQPGITARDADAFGALSIGNDATRLGKAQFAEMRRTQL